MRVLVLNPPSTQAKNVVRDTLYGCWCKGRRIGGLNPPPLNLVSVATVVRDAGHETRFWDAAIEGHTLADVVNEAEGFDAVITSTSTMTFREDASVLEAIREKNPDVLTFIFGSQSTYMSESAVNHHGVDIAVRREPEFIIRDVLDAYTDYDSEAWRGIKGITIKSKRFDPESETIVNPDYPYIEPLDLIPIPDRGMFPKNIDYFLPIVKRMPYTTMITSRGCPALCAFCTAPTFHGKQARTNSAERIIEELEQIVALGYKEIFFRDETFTAYKERNWKVCEAILERNLDLTWICNARVDMIDKETMALMKRAGCHYIKFGVESGDQRILDNIRKGTLVEQAINTFGWAHEVGVDTHAHFMIGNPGDSAETVEKTIEHAIRIDATTASFAISTPYPGTPMFDEVAKLNPDIADGSQSELSGVHHQAFYTETYCDLTPEQIKKYQVKAYRAFYLRPTYLARWIGRMRSIDEFRRLTLAGSNVLGFAIQGTG